MLLNLCNDENYFECDSSLVPVAVLFTLFHPAKRQVMEFGYCKYLLRDVLCWLDTFIKLKRELFTDTKRVKFGKFKDFKRRNRTNPDLLYPAPNLLTNNAIAGQNMRLYFVL